MMISYHTSPIDQPGQGDAGGLNVYVRRISAALAERGHTVNVLTRRSHPDQQATVLPEAPGVRVVPITAGPVQPAEKERMPAWLDAFVDNAATELNEVAAQGCIVVHSHYWMSGLIGQRLARRLSAAWVHTMHTIGAVKNARDDDAEESQERLEAERAIGQTADALVANTETERSELISYCAAPHERVHITPPGVDHAVFRPDGPSRWPRHGGDGEVKLLFAGRFQPHKGPHIILKALAQIADQAPEHLNRFNVHFTGAQSGAAEMDLPRIAEELGVARVCSFSEPMTPQDLAELLRAADALVMPSYSESFGLVALEAQACGTPVLAHRVGGLIYAVPDGDSGRWVHSLNPADWMQELMNIAGHPNEWSQLRGPAARHAANFSWPTTAQALSEVYQEVLTQESVR